MMISKLKALAGGRRDPRDHRLRSRGTRTISARISPPRSCRPVAGERTAVVKRVEVSTDDLIESAGLDIYKFQMDFSKGQRFHVAYRVLRAVT